MSEIECYFNGPWGKTHILHAKKRANHTCRWFESISLAIFDSHKQRWMNILIR